MWSARLQCPTLSRASVPPSQARLLRALTLMARAQVPVEFEASPHSRRRVLQQQLNRNCGALLPPFTQHAISAAGPPGSTLVL
eukprot:1595992-Rhodomonas_salina.1